MKKILIVEDEFMLQMMIEKMIEKMGHLIVAKVKSGDAAIDAVGEFAPDAVLMDVKLIGDDDGIDTVQKIRGFSMVPVIYLTGNTDSSIMERAKQTMPMAVVIKPFEYNSLRVALDEVLTA